MMRWRGRMPLCGASIPPRFCPAGPEPPRATSNGLSGIRHSARTPRDALLIACPLHAVGQFRQRLPQTYDEGLSPMGIDKVSLPARLAAGAKPGIGRKRLIAGVVAAAAAGASPFASAEIELGEGLSVTGFVDTSFVYYDEDGSPTEKVFGIDQVETNFLYSGSGGVRSEERRVGNE